MQIQALVLTFCNVVKNSDTFDVNVCDQMTQTKAQ